jgi:hypothetical protein
MMTSITALSTAVFTGFTVEWLQRKCELWAAARDRNLWLHAGLLMLGATAKCCLVAKELAQPVAAVVPHRGQHFALLTAATFNGRDNWD